MLHIKLFEGAKISADSCAEHFKLMGEITKGDKCVALIDATNFFTVEKEALLLCASKAGANVIAAAYFTMNLANTLTYNFFLAFYKPATPLKLFKSKSDALTWLQQSIG